MRVIGYLQKAGEGTRDKAAHEADSWTAISRYLTGLLSWGGGRRWTEGELYPFGHLASLSLETEILGRTEMTSVITRVFIIERLKTHKI